MGWKTPTPKPVPGTFYNPYFHNIHPPRDLPDWAGATAWMVGLMHGFIGAWATTYGIPGLSVTQRVLAGAGLGAVQAVSARQIRSHSSLASGSSGLGLGSLLGGLYGAWSWRHAVKGALIDFATGGALGAGGALGPSSGYLPASATPRWGWGLSPVMW